MMGVYSESSILNQTFKVLNFTYQSEHINTEMKLPGNIAILSYIFLLFLVSPCSSSPCLNGGNCTNVGNSFLCKCPCGFKGLRCEKDGTYSTYIDNF